MLGMNSRKYSLILISFLLLASAASAMANGLDRTALSKNKINKIDVVMEKKKLHAYHQSLTSDETDEGFFADSVDGKRRNNDERDRQAAPILREISDYDFIGITIEALRNKMADKMFSSSLKIRLLDKYPSISAGIPVIEIDYLFDKDFSALNIRAEVAFRVKAGSETYKKVFLSRFKAWPDTTKPEVKDNIDYWKNNPGFLRSQLSRGIAEVAELIYEDFAAELPKPNKWTGVTLKTPYNEYKLAEIISEKQGRVLLVKRNKRTEVIHAVVDAALLGKRRDRKRGSFFDNFQNPNDDDD